MTDAMTLDEFLGHKTSDVGESVYLRWNKRQPPQVDVWLHTRAGIRSLWQHNFPRIVDLKDEATGATHQEVWGGSFNCWEHESVLRRQYFRDQDGRKFPPEICPFCRMIEAIRRMVETGKLSWIAPIFKFEVGNPKYDQVVHAGGIYNAYGKQNLTAEQLAELKKHHIYRKESWKENGMSKCSYVLFVVDNDAVEKGVLVSVESAGLGDKIKTAIAQRQKSSGRDKGNPILNPYAIRWEHHPDEADLNKRYEAYPMDSIGLSPEVHRLITETVPPDVKNLTMLGNPKLLRGKFEAHWCGPEIDWDWIFGPSMEKFDDSEDDPVSFPFGENADEEERPREIASEPEGKSVEKSEPREVDSSDEFLDEDGVEIVECSNPACEKDMRVTDDVCPYCGAVYDEDGNWSMPVKKKRSRKAAAVGSAKKQTARSAEPKQEEPPPDSNEDWGLGEPEDGIPF